MNQTDVLEDSLSLSVYSSMLSIANLFKVARIHILLVVLYKILFLIITIITFQVYKFQVSIIFHIL